MYYWRCQLMLIEPIALATLTTGVGILANEYLKGFASEAGKTTWGNIKSLLGWSSDPSLADIPSGVAKAVEASPEIAEKLLELLKKDHTGPHSALVGNLEARGGKVVVAGNITHLQM